MPTDTTPVPRHDDLRALYEKVPAAGILVIAGRHGNRRTAWDAGCRGDSRNPEHR